MTKTIKIQLIILSIALSFSIGIFIADSLYKKIIKSQDEIIERQREAISLRDSLINTQREYIEELVITREEFNEAVEKLNK